MGKKNYNQKFGKKLKEKLLVQLANSTTPNNSIFKTRYPVFEYLVYH